MLSIKTSVLASLSSSNRPIAMPPWIPSYQTLGTRSLWKRQSHSALPFPLCAERTRQYYLGRNALYHGAKALGLGQGDEIVFPAYHSGTESAPLLHMGCRLKYYGVRRDLEIDLGEIESLITPATKALYVIHFFGFPAPIAELRKMADRHGIYLIEDVALSLLGRAGDRPLGSWGDVSIFCLYKSVPTAAGGILAVNRNDVELPPLPLRSSFYSELNLTVKHALNHLELHGGRAGLALRRLIEWPCRAVVRRSKLAVDCPDSLDFDPALIDWNMGPITRWLIRRFDYRRIALRRRENYQWLVRRLANTDVAVLREELPQGAVPLFLPVLVKDKFPTIERFHAAGIDAIGVWGIHHPHLPRGEFPDVEFLVDHLIEIQIYQDLTEEHLERIAEAMVDLASWPGLDRSPQRSTRVELAV